MNQSNPVSTDEKKQRNAEIIRFAAKLMKNGIADNVIRSKIVVMGLTDEQASAVINTLRKVRKEVQRKTGQRNMLIGGLICLAGIIITVATLSATRGGGTYILMWGAILFGGVQCTAGVIQYLGK